MPGSGTPHVPHTFLFSRLLCQEKRSRKMRRVVYQNLLWCSLNRVELRCSLNRVLVCKHGWESGESEKGTTPVVRGMTALS